jgi:UDP-N-acetylmuramate dehydrogenase
MMPLSVPSHWTAEVPTAELTSWGVGGAARFVSRPATHAALIDDLRLARAFSLPLFVIGGGSNLLFSDAGYPGLLLRLPAGPARAESGATATGAAQITLRVPAGASLTRVARQAAARGWAGLAWAEGIPGSVGGAIVNNAGAHGGSIADALAAVRLLLPDAAEAECPARDLALGYRASRLKGRDPTEQILIEATLQLSLGDPQQLAQRHREIAAQRAQRIPPGRSCGSVFRNPPDQSAGALIERAGLAGARVGEAQVSEVHANVILNRGGARAAEILALMRRIRARVREESGILLEPEVQLVGFGPDPLGSDGP